MGFSSGGHLAATTSTLFDDAPESDPALKQFSARPDFTILVYSVISITQEFMHSGSRLRLLGPNPDPALTRKFSPETQVKEDTPPCLLSIWRRLRAGSEQHAYYLAAQKPKRRRKCTCLPLATWLRHKMRHTRRLLDRPRERLDQQHGADAAVT